MGFINWWVFIKSNQKKQKKNKPVIGNDLENENVSE